MFPPSSSRGYASSYRGHSFSFSIMWTSSNPFPVCIRKKLERGSSNKNFRITRKEAHITNSTSLEWQVSFKTNTPAIESEAWNHLCILRFLHWWRLRDVLLLTLACFGKSEEWHLWFNLSCVDPPNVSGPGSLWVQHPPCPTFHYEGILYVKVNGCVGDVLLSLKADSESYYAKKSLIKCNPSSSGYMYFYVVVLSS